MRYYAFFSKNIDDPGDFVERPRPTLEAAKRCCEQRVDEDVFEMPRVYVRETAQIPADDLHVAATEDRTIGFHELEGGEWTYFDLR